MKLINISLLFLLALFSCNNNSNKGIISGKIEGLADSVSQFLLIENERIHELSINPQNHSFSFDMKIDTSRFIQLGGVVGNDDAKWQIIIPLFQHSGKGLNFKIVVNENKYELKFPEKDENNKALNDYNQFYINKSRELWNQPPTPDKAEAFILGYKTKAEELIAQNKLSQPVEQYLKIWSYLEYLNAINSLSHLYSQQPELTLPAGLEKKVPTPIEMLDNDIALSFSLSLQYIEKELNQTTRIPEKKIKLLKEKIKTPQIRQELIRNIVRHYVSTYNYQENFDEGLARLKNMCESLQPNDTTLITEFSNKKYSAEGAPLPTAFIEDLTGKKYQLSDFKGKYLYIDLWASWCAPCCAEVPHLQKLEKELKNKDVQFISISLDANKEAWKKKMEQLDMKGHQFVVSDNSLGSMLNVSGIPHFLLYNKEGILIQYQAPRPSSGEEIKTLLENLK